MTFCFSPWTNLDISPQGDIMPCCKFQTKYYTEKFNVQIHNVDDYVNSNFLRQVKRQMQEGQWPSGCERCQIEEQNNIDSKRILDYQRWRKHYESVDLDNADIITASIAFGNTCNLKCITCNSVSSSKWYQEAVDIYGVDRKPVHFYRDTFIEKLVQQVPNLVHLDVPGGEPFLSGISQQLALLDFYIENNRAGDVTLHYTTNATIYPGIEWWQRWKHFKEIDMQLSIDGVAARYEYIRNPASWEILQDNVDKYLSNTAHNLRLSVSHTVSAYNIFYLDEFVQWCYNKGLPRPWLGRVHNPAHMRPGVWPQSVRQKISQHLSQSKDPDVLAWADLVVNTDDSEHWENFNKYLRVHDRYRGTEFDSVFPELLEFLQ